MVALGLKPTIRVRTISFNITMERILWILWYVLTYIVGGSGVDFDGRAQVQIGLYSFCQFC